MKEEDFWFIYVVWNALRHMLFSEENRKIGNLCSFNRKSTIIFKHTGLFFYIYNSKCKEEKCLLLFCYKIMLGPTFLSLSCCRFFSFWPPAGYKLAVPSLFYTHILDKKEK